LFVATSKLFLRNFAHFQSSLLPPTMDVLLRVADTVKSFREQRLSGLRSPTEFFDIHRISRPADLNQATSRISYNTRYFSGNYGVVIVMLAIYAMLNNPILLIAIGFLVGGFAAINRFVSEPLQFGDQVVTQQRLYTVLFCIGLPLLWWASPVATVFWLLGSSGFLILGHAMIMEPGVESEYAQVQDSV